MPLAFQPADDLYRGSGFDRGHLAAPAAVTWGDSPDAQIAMDQSFFLTNTTPQTAAFNQRSWQALEAREREVAAIRGRAVGISGPVFAADDHDLGGVQVRGRLRSRGTFRVPRTFFKVVVAEGAGGELEVVSYELENAQEKASPVAVSLELLQARTGLVFPESLHAARPLGGF